MREPLSSAMVLAAGYGRRMAPITTHTPKPLVTVAGEPLLDRALRPLERAGVQTIVVNTHHLAGEIEAYLVRRPGQVPVELSHESELLETGGGVKKALDLLDDPFFVLNGDIYWRDGATPALDRLAQAFDPGRMDALLLIYPRAGALGYDGPGDFELTADGCGPAPLSWRAADGVAPYVFAGIQVLAKSLFTGAPQGAFSLNLLYRKAEAAGRLYGLVHDGDWCHVSRPADIAAVEAWLAAEAGSAERPSKDSRAGGA
ncbi:MAG: nucleotidyltransferase family protein [Alphaproteobacteria bacterium]